MNRSYLKKRDEKLYHKPPFAINISMTRKAVNDSGRAQAVSFDHLLVLIGKDRDKAAFIDLFKHFAPRVKAYLIKNGMNDSQADELAQETLLTVWHKAERYNPEKANASTWIFTIARNKRIDALRKIYRDDPDIDFDNNDPDLPDQSFEETEKSEHIAAAVKTLPDEQKILIEKAFFEDKTHSTIANEMGLPLGTVKSRIRMALSTLRKKLNMFKGEKQ